MHSRARDVAEEVGVAAVQPNAGEHTELGESSQKV